MSLGRSFALYLALVHLAVAITLGVLLYREHRLWLLALEAALAVSLVVGIVLVRRLGLPRQLADVGTEWMREADFTHTFRETGRAELDRLTKLYNAMIVKLRDERLRSEEQEFFLARLTEASPVGIVTTDHDGAIASVNPAACALLGTREEALLGRAPDEAGLALLTELARVPLGESRLLGERAGRRLRGSHARFIDRSFPRSFFLLTDLTHELWSVEKRAYDSLIRTLSHEVNNTLGATRSILHSALRYGVQLQGEDRDDFEGALEVALARTDHLGTFMRRYAEVVKLPSPSRAPLDLGELLRGIARLIEAECRELAIDVVLELQDDASEPPTIDGDVVLMEQALLNIARNGIEAIGERGTLTLRASVRDTDVLIDIVDSGPGLSDDARENLFTPFFSTKRSGQGVGLTLVREILRQHGYDFALRSEPGLPTRFRIVAPRS